MVDAMVSMQAALFLWKHLPQSYAALFEADKNSCIQQWFDHFGSAGNTSFSFGARALTSYAIAHREEVDLSFYTWQKRHFSCRNLILTMLQPSRCAYWWSVLHLKSQYSGLYCLQVWDLLVWSDGQSRSPVAVVAKLHYFARLDVTQTVKNFAAECPRFWSSEEFRDTLKGSSILALNSAFFVQVLCMLPLLSKQSILLGILAYRLPCNVV